MGKIALSMIVAGYEKPEDLRRCLLSAADFVDGIFITITSKTEDDGLMDVANDFNATVHYKPKKFNKKVTKTEHKWVKKHAAKSLNIPESTLRLKMKQYGLAPEKKEKKS